MADNYTELSTSGWAVVSDKGKVFGSDSDNESGEQSDYVSLDRDVVRYHHNSSSSKDGEDDVATGEETDKHGSESTPVMTAKPPDEQDPLKEPDPVKTGVVSKEDMATNLTEDVSSEDMATNVTENVSSEDMTANVTVDVITSDNNGIDYPGGYDILDNVLPKLERGMSISDVIEDNVRARLNISRSRLSTSTSSANDFLLDDVNKSRESHDLTEDGSDTSGEAVSNVEMNCDVNDVKVQDIKEQTVSDSDSDFEHLSQEEISNDKELKSDKVNAEMEEKNEELNVVDEIASKSEPNAPRIPPSFQTTSDDSDSSRVFNPERGRRGIRKRCIVRRSRHSSASMAASTESVLGHRQAVGGTQYEEFTIRKLLYILLLVLALGTGYYIGSSQTTGYKKHVEQGQAKRLHTLQDELLSCLSSDDVNNNYQINIENIHYPDKQTDDVTTDYSRDPGNGKQHLDLMNIDPVIKPEEPECEKGKDEWILKEKNFIDAKNTISHPVLDNDMNLHGAVELFQDRISVGGGDWMEIEDAIGINHGSTAAGKQTDGGGDWIEMEDAIGKNHGSAAAGKQTDGGGDWMEMEDAIGKNHGSAAAEKKIDGRGDRMEIEDAVKKSAVNQNKSAENGYRDVEDINRITELDEVSTLQVQDDDKQTSIEGIPKGDKLAEYEARISELEAHYREIDELYKQKALAPQELVQDLYEKIISLESQLKIATNALESRPTFEPDNKMEDADASGSRPTEPSENWMDIFSFDGLKKKFDDAVQKTDPTVIWVYYDKTKKAIDVANKATMDAIGKVYDYTKSDEFASNVADTKQKLQDTLSSVNDAMSSQWETVKKSSEDVSAYVRETGENAKIRLAEKSEQVKKSISEMDLGKKWEELKNFTTSGKILNKTKSTLDDLTKKVVKMKEYTESDEFKASVSKTKDSILESLDEAVKTTKKSVSGLKETLGDTWSTVKSKATDNWEAVKAKTGFGNKKNHKNKKENQKNKKKHKKNHQNKKHCNKKHRKEKKLENKHNQNQREIYAEDVENINVLLTGNWRELYAKYFNVNCRGDHLCIDKQRKDAEILIQELLEYSKWLEKNKYKKDAKKIKQFFNELWPLVNGHEVDDIMLEGLKDSLGFILKSMNQRAQRHRELYVETYAEKKPDGISGSMPRKDGRRFSGNGFHSNDDSHFERQERVLDERVNDFSKRENKKEINYDWFTLRGMGRERGRQAIEGDWFLRRGRDRESSRRKSDSDEESGNPNWYFKWAQSRNEMRTGMSMWDLYNWFHDWHDHRHFMRHTQ